MPESYFLLPNGTRVPAAASDAVTLPADLMGEASLFLPGRVPSTLVIGAGDTVPPETHPAPNTSVARPFTSGMVTGSLVGLEGNVVVRFEEPSRLSQAATTSAVGQPFSLTVPAASPTTGLLIANDTDSTPRLAIKQLTVLPGETVDAGDLTLEISTGEALAPAAPAGMTPTGASLLLVDAGRLLPILSVLGGRLPTYTLPGVTTVHSFQAASQDGERFSRTSGAAGLVPAFLEAPSLAGLPARLRAGTRLSWPGVPGATLYTLRLAERTNAGPPLWEGATTGTQVTVPGDLALGGRSLELWVDAWDAQEVSLFSVAAARMLRVPQEPNAPVGRHSSAVRRYFP